MAPYDTTSPYPPPPSTTARPSMTRARPRLLFEHSHTQFRGRPDNCLYSKLTVLSFDLSQSKSCVAVVELVPRYFGVFRVRAASTSSASFIFRHRSGEAYLIIPLHNVANEAHISNDPEADEDLAYHPITTQELVTWGLLRCNPWDL